MDDLENEKNQLIRNASDTIQTKLKREERNINSNSRKNSSIREVAKRKMKNSIGIISMQFKC